MHDNLLLAYFVNINPEKLENELIKELNPPLNISKNPNIINAKFRDLLSKLRNRPLKI